jgi:hypothetical protein
MILTKSHIGSRFTVSEDAGATVQIYDWPSPPGLIDSVNPQNLIDSVPPRTVCGLAGCDFQTDSDKWLLRWGDKPLKELLGQEP